MHYVLYSTVALVILMTLSASLWMLWQTLKVLNAHLQTQQREIQRQNNLLASKDMTTFSTIQTLSNNQVMPVMTPFDGLAGDDISVARAIAERYEKAGIDPAAAYDDPETALSELGLKGHGF